jgi:large subunit ribosomal protein L21
MAAVIVPTALPEAPDICRGIDNTDPVPSLHVHATPQGATTKMDEEMYAVIKTGGKQYRVAADDVLEIERLDGDAGARIEFSDVLMVGAGDGVKIGTPMVAGAKVIAEVVEQTRGPKLIAFKKRRRQNSRRKKGHRQDLTKVRITEIQGA